MAWEHGERELLANLKSRIELLEAKIDTILANQDRDLTISLLREVLRVGQANQQLAEKIMSDQEDLAALIGQLNDRTNEIREDVLSIKTRTAEMREDLIAVRDRIQRLIDSNNTVGFVKEELQKLLSDKVNPLVTDAEEVAREVDPVAADLDALGRDPENPIPPGEEPPPGESPPA